MNGLFYAAIGSYFATIVVIWLGHPAALYLQLVPSAFMVAWVILRWRRGLLQYRALKLRQREREREFKAILDRQA